MIRKIGGAGIGSPYLSTAEACKAAGVAYHTLRRAAEMELFLKGLPKGTPAMVQRGVGRTCPWYFHRTFVENVKSRYAVGSLQPT